MASRVPSVQVKGLLWPCLPVLLFLEQRRQKDETHVIIDIRSCRQRALGISASDHASAVLILWLPITGGIFPVACMVCSAGLGRLLPARYMLATAFSQLL